MQKLAAEGHTQVLLALLVSYPSTDVKVRCARDALLAVVPYAVSPCTFCIESLAIPKVSHNTTLLHASAYHTPVGENGLLGFSPYLCPFIGTSYSADYATQYLKSRPDRCHFLYKLSRRTLVCNCCFSGYGSTSIDTSDK